MFVRPGMLLASLLLTSHLTALPADRPPSIAAFKDTSQNVTRSTKHNPALLAKSQEQFVPYWTAEPGWHTDLQLRNNLPNQPLTVTPVLRTADGTEASLGQVELQPMETRSLDLHDSIMKMAPQLMGSYGSVVIR